MSDQTFHKFEILELTLKSHNGKEIKLNHIFSTINIYEDLLNNVLLGKVVLIDTFDLMKNLPLVGNEEFKITWKAVEDPIYKTVTLQVYKIDNDSKTQRGNNNKEKSITLYMVSAEQIKSDSMRVSRTFNAKPEIITHTVLQDILKSKKKYQSDITSEKATVYTNYWNPLKIINYSSYLAKTTNYDYIFYEDLDGFNFKSVSDLMMRDSVATWNYHDALETKASINNIKMYQFDSYFDLIFNSKLGNFGGTFFKQDNIYTTIHKTALDVAQICSEKIGTLGNNSIFDQTMSTVQNNMKVCFNDPEMELVRKISLSMLRNYNLIVKLNGSTKRKVGQIVDIKFPTHDNESIVNENFNGKWLITQVNHILSADFTYEQNFRIVKNAMFANKNLPKIASKKNV